jgi:hypothetical protein
MNARNLYTRTQMGLDNRVWLALLVTLLLSGVLLGFKIATHETCNEISILITNNENAAGAKYHPQDRLTFVAKMAGAKEVEWDFGDNTPPAKGSSLIHSFGNPGSYFVTATINGKCREFINVVVNTNYVPTGANSIAVTGEDISGPDAPKAGEPVSYVTSLNATTYEWNVLNSPEYPTQSTPAATYTFLTPGTKNIELKLDNGKVYRKTIQVLPGDRPLVDPSMNNMPQEMPVVQQDHAVAEPEPEQQAAPKSTFIADEVFRDMLDKVADGDKDASSFNQFLCNGAQTKVRDNGESWTTLGEFCSKIHSKKKFQIKSVVTIRDPNDKCVLQLQVKYKKKGFLGL